MKKLYSYIIKSYIGPFIATFFIALFVLLMQFVWKYIDDMVGKGFEWHVIARLLFYASSTFVPLALPLAVLLSSLMTFGNLGERYEIVALKASGISIKTIMKPMMVFIFLLSIIAFLFSNNIMPVANLKMRTLLHNVRKQKPAVSIQPGIFYNEIENYTIKINKKENDGKTIKDIVIYDHTKQQGNVSITTADSGIMQVTKDKRYLVLQLYQGVNFMERIQNRDDKFSRPLQITEFNEEIRRIDLSSFSFEDANDQFYKNHYKMMNINQLKQAKDSIKVKTADQKIKLDSTVMGRFPYFNLAGKKAGNPEPITYSNINKIFDDTHARQQKQKEDTKPGILQRHVLKQRGKISEDPPRESIAKKERPRAKDTASQPPELSHNTKGYTRDGISSIAEKKGMELDSLIRFDKNFPTLLFDNHKLEEDLLNNFKTWEQERIVKLAINNVRNVINHIDYTDNVIHRMEELMARQDIEYHRKFTLPFACIVLFFIGAPFGAIIRKGGFGFPVVVAVLLFVVYHVISMTGEKFAREGVIETWWGMWVSSFILLPFGIFLALKATTDAPFLNPDTYVNAFKKIRALFFKPKSS
ncbi:MAG: LptF/LptG family permease [Bacteroidales bacterium]